MKELLSRRTRVQEALLIRQKTVLNESRNLEEERCNVKR